MSLLCLLRLHDWKYDDLKYRIDRGSYSLYLTTRICKRCDKEEHGRYGVYGIHDASHGMIATEDEE